MKWVGIRAARTRFSRLVDGAAPGEGFIIAKSGRPMVKVVPFDAPDELAQRRIGVLAGVSEVPDDFDSMGAGDIADSFEGSH